MGIKIAIDGPSGAGKSTLSRKLAEKLGFTHVDTGALYRAVGLFVLNNGVSPDDVNAVEALLPQIAVSIRFTDGEQRVYLNGNDVSAKIRMHEVSQAASLVSAVPAVRQFLLETQRRIAEEQNVIMDGRDIATVVLPDADVKIFLTASAEIRARRRYLELIERGQTVEYEQILSDVKQRDFQDENRPIAPLRPAEDSVIADTSELDFDQSLALLEKIVLEGLKKNDR